MKRRAGIACTVPNSLRARVFLGKRTLPIVRAILFASTAVVLSACGGGGGGGGATPAPAPLATGTFIRIFGPAASDGIAAPFATGPVGDIKHQMLYTAAEIGGAGRITALRFKYFFSAATGVTCPNTTIRLGHTSLSALTATFGTNVNQGSGSQRKVLDNTTVTLPAGAAGAFFEIAFATPFEYNGIDNLVVEVERTTACSGQVFTAFVNAGGNRSAISFAIDTVQGTAQHNQTTASVVDTTHLLQQFVFSGGDDLVRYPTNSIGFSAPFTPVTTFRHAQMLHRATDINGSGPITGIALITTEAPTDAAAYTVNIKLGHTSLAALTDTFANNFNSGSPVSAATAATFNVPAGVPAGTPIWLPLTGVFDYNGTDNLIVDIEVTTASTATDLAVDTFTNAGRVVFAAVGSATGAVQAGAFYTVFRFNGGTMDVIGANSASTGVFGGVFGSSARGFQFLLRAAELGSSGAIDKLACRLGVSSSAAASYPNFTVTLAHTTQTALVADDATNVAGGTTVYSGTFNMPAGLLVGDWVEIPFSTPFIYNGVDNLVVQTTTGPGPSNQFCQIAGLDAIRFPDRFKSTGALLVPLDFRGTFRFWVNK